MPSNSDIKKIKSLQQKKFRKQLGLFVAEGEKVVQELLASLYVVEDVFRVGDNISSKELERISSLKTPNNVLAVARIKSEEPDFTVTSILLDGVSDPGNLGTIIRLADWYGIKQIVCSNDTVDCFSPKVVQSTMGSLFRVNVVYMELEDFITRSECPTQAAVMDGDSDYKCPGKFNLLMGSESHGIRNDLDRMADKRITIKRIGEAESLNVGVATGILLDRLFRLNNSG